MSYDPWAHPRGGNIENPGQFSHKVKGVAELSLKPETPAEPSGVFAETQRLRRGHRFYPTKDVLTKTPGMYVTDNWPTSEKVIHAHYFVGGMDWYVAEYDKSSGEAFGFCDLGHGDGEWGYFDLCELERQSVGVLRQPVERDLDFTPIPFRTVRPKLPTVVEEDGKVRAGSHGPYPIKSLGSSANMYDRATSTRRAGHTYASIADHLSGRKTNVDIRVTEEGIAVEGRLIFQKNTDSEYWRSQAHSAFEDADADEALALWIRTHIDAPKTVSA